MSEISSNEVWIVGKLTELFERHGIDPLDIDFFLMRISNESEYSYLLTVADTTAGTPIEAKVDKLLADLKISQRGGRRLETLDELWADLKPALDLAPRSHTRGL